MAWRRSALIAILCLAPGAAAADGLYLPGLGLPGLGGPESDGPRPSYREAYDAYPPPQHNILGMPVAPPSPYDRPSYRETYDDFPPPRGRYGGGIVEYVMTGGRSGLLPAPAPAPVYAAPAGFAVQGYPVQAYAVPAYPPAAVPEGAAALPRSGLPDYAPEQPPAFYGSAPVGR